MIEIFIGDADITAARADIDCARITNIEVARSPRSGWTVLEIETADGSVIHFHNMDKRLVRALQEAWRALEEEDVA